MKDKRNDYYVYYFTALSWCGPCIQMHAEVWPNPEVKKQLSYFKTGELKVFPEERVKTDQDVRKFYERFKVTSLPTIIIVDGNGKEIKRTSGYKTVDQVKKFLEVGK